jgi:hypothetical protein
MVNFTTQNKQIEVIFNFSLHKLKLLNQLEITAVIYFKFRIN